MQGAAKSTENFIPLNEESSPPIHLPPAKFHINPSRIDNIGIQQVYRHNSQIWRSRAR